MESKAGPTANPSVQSSHSSVTSPAGGSSDNAANATCNTLADGQASRGTDEQKGKTVRRED